MERYTKSVNPQASSEQLLLKKDLELESLLDKKLLNFVSLLLGDYKILSSSSYKEIVGFTLSTEKFGLVRVDVYGADSVRIYKVSPVAANQVVIENGYARVEVSPRIRETWEKEGYRRVSVQELVTSASRSPDAAKIYRALSLLNVRLDRGDTAFSVPSRSPVGEFLKRASGEKLVLTHVYYSYLPGGLSIYLVHQSKRVGTVALSELFVPTEKERPKIRLLESRKSPLSERIDAVSSMIQVMKGGFAGEFQE